MPREAAGERGPQGAAERGGSVPWAGRASVHLQGFLQGNQFSMKYKTELPGFPSSSLFRKWHAAPQKSFSVQSHSQSSIQDVTVHKMTDVRRMVLSYKNAAAVSAQTLLHEAVRGQKMEWFRFWRNYFMKDRKSSEYLVLTVQWLCNMVTISRIEQG